MAEQPCTLIDRVPDSESDWEYIFAEPIGLGGSLSVGQPARPLFYYMRSYDLRYHCACGGKEAEVIVRNNFEIGTIEEPSLQPYMTASVSISMPAGLGSAATQIAIGVAEAVFGSLSSTIGWLEPEAVKARAEELLGDPDVVETKPAEVPVAVCGDHIRYGSGVKKDWPAQGEVLPPPTPEEEEAVRIQIELASLRGRFGRLIERWAEQIRDMLRSADEATRERGRRQLEQLRRTIDRILEILREMAEEAQDAAPGD